MEPIKLLKTTVFASLIVQIITGILNIGVAAFDFKAFTFSDESKILVKLLWLAIFVQIIEGIFYVWLANSFDFVKNITVYRYYDWFITTPTMLFTIIAFMVYKNKQNEEKESDIEKNTSIKQIFSENKNTILLILLLNAIMLMFGFLGEKKKISRNAGFLYGSIAFCGAFYLMYVKFVNNVLINKQTFWFNFILWALYGVAYKLSYKNQNIAYNILDIFSKNLNGLLIFGYIYFLKYNGGFL